ncbi:MAG: lipoprotein insertase outer membrane protein LolB [Gammaproteobacteria bacterium]
MNKLFPFFLVVLLVGCTAQPSRPDWEAGRTLLLEAEDWQFRGRMAVKIEDPALQDEVSGGQASIVWLQERDVSRIRLSGPLGAGAWELIWDPYQVSASDTKGKRSVRYTGPEAAELFMRQELGWVFPADNIRYWLRGLPAPGAAAEEEFGADGQLERILQQGWEVSYDRYGNFEGHLLPARLTIRGRGIRLRLVISRWDINSLVS